MSSSEFPYCSIAARKSRHGMRPGAMRLTPLAAALAAYLVAGSVAAPAQAAAPVGGAWFASQGHGQVQAARQAGMKHGLLGTGSVSRQNALTQQSLQRSMANVNRTAAAIAAHQAAQRAAREQALGGASDIPDGLGLGGLETDLAAGWLNAMEPSQSQQGGRTEVTIKQTAKKAILNWKTFNVGRDTTVHFDQSAGSDAKTGNTWAALNRIDDPSGRPSRIAGQIKAEGAVYLINRNGVVFHGTSQVNTRTLIASSLQLSDDQFMAGINKPTYFELNGNNLAIPQFGEFPDRNNFVDGEIFEPGPIPGDVRVEAGAEIAAHTGGKVMLFGPKVANAGRISAPDGQVILAAGENVFLKSPNPEDIDAVRGLDVAVAAPAPRAFNYWHLTSAFFRGGNENDKIIMERDVLPAMRARAAEAGYEASNTGVVSADRGNITMQALDVRQDGALLASTALDNRNGSIELRAWGQGTHAHSSDINRLANWDSGSLTLGSNSVTQVIPDAGDTGEIELAALATRYEPGRVVLYGKVVDLQGGSNVWAPAGNIDIQSAANAFYIQESSSRKPGGGSLPDGNRIYIDSGAFLGVGGLQGVSVPTGRNFIEAEFRINELRDSPMLRDSWLRGQKVVIDRRISGTFGEGPMAGVEWVRDADGKPVPGAWVGTPLGDMTGWVGVGKTDLQELSTIGGTISLVTQNGDVITRPGSLIDISGGSVRYSGGLNTSTLLQGADGRYYDIGRASPGMVYVGVAGEYVRQHARWGVSDTWRNPVVVRPRHEPGYTEGRGAGAVEIKAGRAIVLEGDLWGGAVTGDRQADGAPPLGGSLVVGGGAFSDTTWSLGRLVIGAHPLLLPDDFTAGSPIDEAWYKTLAPEETGTGESGRIKQTWVSDGMLSGSGLGDIMMFLTDDGRIDASASVELSPGASLRLLPVENAVIDFVVEGTVRAPGGTINISGERVELAAGSQLDTAGQWVNAWQDGLQARPAALDGGSVRIIGQLVAQAGSVIDVSGGARLARQGGKRQIYAGNAGDIGLVGVDAGSGLAGIDLRGYAAGSSGTLEIVANTDIQIGGVPEDGTVLAVPETLFGEKGFGSVTVSAPGRSVVVPAGVQAGLATRVVDLADGRYVDVATGAHITELGTVAVPRLDESLARAPGSLLLSGTRIEIGAGAVLRTGLAGQLSLNAQAEGQIDVHGILDAPAGVINLEGDTISLYQGAQLLARGLASIYPGEQGRRVGQVLPGGQVSLAGRRITTQRGSLIDVSGTSGWVDELAGGLPERTVRMRGIQLTGAAGAISIAGTGTIEGSMVAHAGGPDAAGGSLEISYAMPDSGQPSALEQILESLRYMDPDCYGLAGNGMCGDNDPWEAVGVDWASYVRDTYGIPVDEPLVIPRELLAQLEDSKRFIISDEAPGPQGLNPPLDPAEFGLTETALNLLRDYMLYTDVLRDGMNNPGQDYTLAVRPAAFGQGGFADLSLRTDEIVPIQFDRTALTLGRSIALQGAIVSMGAGQVTLQAPYISLSGAKAATPATEGLAGQLSLQASVIDIAGVPHEAGWGARIAGFAGTVLQARDVRLGSLPGEIVALDVDGRLVLRAGQVYPATAVQATVRAGDAIRVERLGEAAAPLSAGGILRLEAPVIEQSGVLRAPFGQIQLAAGRQLALEAGSLTSVSGAPWTVPYGNLSNGEYWLNPALLQLDGINASDYQLAAPPEKRIVMEAPEVLLNEGSQVDISGGGDLHAWEFVPGPGGSHDVLAQAGMYAVLPGYGGLSPVSGVAAGNRIWLAGGGGLPAGWHTLLPARYALLPGAYAVQATGQGWSRAAAPAAYLGDGGLVMQGRLANTGAATQDARGSAWRVMSGGVLRSYTEYNEARANDFFSSDGFKLTQYRLTGKNVVTPRLPRDGGAVVFKAGERLLLDGELRSEPAAGGLGGMVDIAGQKIAIIGAGHDASGLRADGYLIIDADSLTGFGAGSLLVGGTRQGDPLGMRVDVTASDIIVRNGQDSVLAGPEIILAASAEIAIDAGSRIAVSSGSGASSGSLVMAPQREAVYADPDGNLDDNWDGVIDDQDAADDILVEPQRDWGALLRVSNGQAVSVVRENVDTSVGGRVSVGENARLDGGAALLIDATRTTDLAASAQLVGADLSVSSGRIGFGGTGSGMVLDSAALAQLSQSRQLTLRSYSIFDFHQSVDLGGAGLQAVVLDGASLVGHGGHDVRVKGVEITLQNTTGGAAVPAAGGGGTLLLDADTLVLGAGEKSVAGFGALMLAATQEIVGQGSGVLDAVASAVTLRSPLLTGRNGANQSLRTQGDIHVLQVAPSNGQAPAGSRQDSLGSRLALTGRNVLFGGHASVLGGTVALMATGGDVVVADGARIDVSGSARHLYDLTEYADAGRVELSALGGDVRLQAGSMLNLAAHRDGGSAGTLSVTADDGGTVQLDGSIDAQAGRDGLAGAFALDIDTLTDFAGINARLNEAGFDRARSFRVREGNVVIDGTTRVQNFTLTADRGNVLISGIVDARALYGGTIRVTGGNGVAMREGAQLLAGSTGELGSGRVTLEAVGGRLDATGGLIDVSGGELGKVRLRAQRTADNGDLAVNPLGVRVNGAREAVLEGMRVYASDTVETVKAQAVADALHFSERASAISARLGAGDFAIMPGIEIRSDGDLSMTSDWNLHADFGAARAGSLTLRAAGNLNITGHLSDGFDMAGRDGVLQTGPSWDLRLVAGADLSSADVLALRSMAGLAEGQGTITVGTADSGPDAQDGAGRLIRTGTGDLAVRAGRDLVLAHKESVIYTAGRRDTTTWSDFTTAAPNAVYGVNGGNLDISAQGKIEAQPSGQRFVEWLKRQGNLNASGYFGPYSTGRYIYIPEYPYVLPREETPQQSSWWIDHGAFQQGVGALGGGNVTISAGGDLDNLVVALSSNMRMRGGRTATEDMHMEVRNGGAMTIDAGGAIRGGQYYLARGTGRISAGETTVGHTVRVTKDQVAQTFSIAPVFALGDAELSVRTAGDLRVQALIDPLMVRNGYDGTGTPPGPDDMSNLGAYMSGYTDRSALALTSIGGDVTLVNQADFAFRDVQLQSSTSEIDNLIGHGGNLYPAQLHVAALNGSLEIQGPMYVVPATRHDVRLLAQQDVRFNTRDAEVLRYFISDSTRPVALAEIIMSIATPAMMPSPFKPVGDGGYDHQINMDPVLRNVPNGYLSPSPYSRDYLQGVGNPLELPLAGDFEPSRIYASQGSITGLNLDASEQAWVRAGRDIRSVNLQGRNLRAADVTLLEAGNDIVAVQPVYGSLAANGVQMQGPGLLLLSAGRDVYAGKLAVQTLGNQRYDLNNRPLPNTQVLGLPAQGAAITVMAGMNAQAAYDVFADAYLNPAKVAEMSGYLTQTVNGTVLPVYLMDAVEDRQDGKEKNVRRGLVSYVRAMTGEDLDPLAAWQRFGELPDLVRQQFLRQVFLQELRDAGRDQNLPGTDGLPRNGGYNRGYAAIDALFPGDGWQGDVAANSLTLRTMAGGDIQVLTPGGGLQVAALGTVAEPGEGIVTLASGHINLFAHDDVVVNQSRVLSFVAESTGQGSDQIIWATQGDIDAGRGAKTVRVPSAPDIVTDVDGNTLIMERSDMSGSGIGTVGEGDVDLVAPEGTINFGDAGVRVAGNFNVAALTVLNAANVEVQGESTGLPATVSVNTGALSAASSAASTAASSAQEMASRQRNEARRKLPSIISVQILGFGNETPAGMGAPSGSGGRAAEPLVYRSDSPVQVVGDGQLGPAQLARLTSAERSRFGM